MAVASPTLRRLTEQALNAQRAFVADFLFPTVPVTEAIPVDGGNAFKATAYRVAKNNARQLPGDTSLLQAFGQELVTVNTTIEDYDLVIRKYGAKSFQDEDAFNAMNGMFSTWEQTIAKTLAEAIAIDKERRALKFVDTAANFAAGHTFAGSASTYWNNDNNDPDEQFVVARDRLIQMGGLSEGGAIHLVFSPKDFDAYRNNAKIRAKFGDGYSPQKLTPFIEHLRGVLQPDPDAEINLKVRIASAVSQPGNLGDPDDQAYLWNGRTVLAAVPREGANGIQDRGWAKGYALASNGFTNALRSKRFMDDNRRGFFWQSECAKEFGLFDNTLALLWDGIREE
jgi:hypothetical protein